MLDEIHQYGCNPTTNEIFLCKSFDSPDDTLGFREAILFEKNLRAMSGPILIHCHLNGGNWNDGMAIYDSLITCPYHTTILVYGSACSMTSIIVQGADYRVLMPNCEVMLHHGWAEEDNTSTGLISRAGIEKIRQKKTLEIYANRCKDAEYFKSKKIDEIISFLDKKITKMGDWWLSAKDAVNMGLADAIFGISPNKTLEEIRAKANNKRRI